MSTKKKIIIRLKPEDVKPRRRFAPAEKIHKDSREKRGKDQKWDLDSFEEI